MGAGGKQKARRKQERGKVRVFFNENDYQLLEQIAGGQGLKIGQVVKMAARKYAYDVLEQAVEMYNDERNKPAGQQTALDEGGNGEDQGTEGAILEDRTEEPGNTDTPSV